MRLTYHHCCSVFALILSLLSFTNVLSAADLKSLSDFKDAEKKFNLQLTIPKFPESEKEIKSMTDEVIARFTKTGDQVAALKPVSPPRMISLRIELMTLYITA